VAIGNFPGMGFYSINVTGGIWLIGELYS